MRFTFIVLMLSAGCLLPGHTVQAPAVYREPVRVIESRPPPHEVRIIETRPPPPPQEVREEHWENKAEEKAVKEQNKAEEKTLKRENKYEEKALKRENKQEEKEMKRRMKGK